MRLGNAALARAERTTRYETHVAPDEARNIRPQDGDMAEVEEARAAIEEATRRKGRSPWNEERCPFGRTMGVISRDDPHRRA
jgi:hypothetical protein